MDVRKMRNEKLGARVVAALNSRNMEAYYVETKEEAVKKALELIPKGSSINMGGATSVKECGLYDAISNGEYEFYDRDKVKTPEEKEEIARKAFSSDYFRQCQCHERGWRVYQYRWKCQSCGCVCLWTKACSADCGYEQSRKIRGRRPAPCAE